MAISQLAAAGSITPGFRWTSIVLWVVGEGAGWPLVDSVWVSTESHVAGGDGEGFGDGVDEDFAGDAFEVGLCGDFFFGALNEEEAGGHGRR